LQQLVKGDASVVLVSYEEKKSVGEKLGLAAAGIVETLSTRLWSHGRRTNIQS